MRIEKKQTHCRTLSFSKQENYQWPKILSSDDISYSRACVKGAGYGRKDLPVSSASPWGVKLGVPWGRKFILLTHNSKLENTFDEKATRKKKQFQLWVIEYTTSRQNSSSISFFHEKLSQSIQSRTLNVSQLITIKQTIRVEATQGTSIIKVMYCM